MKEMIAIAATETLETAIFISWFSCRLLFETLAFSIDFSLRRLSGLVPTISSLSNSTLLKTSNSATSTTTMVGSTLTAYVSATYFSDDSTKQDQAWIDYDSVSHLKKIYRQKSRREEDEGRGVRLQNPKPRKIEFLEILNGFRSFSFTAVQMRFYIVVMALVASVCTISCAGLAALAESAQEPGSYRLSKALIGDDGRIYTCSERKFLAFESNGSIAWTIPLNYTCHYEIAPVWDGKRRIYLIADNKVLKIKPSESSAEVFFALESTMGGSGEVIGLAVSMLSSSIFINVKNQGLFAYKLRGQLLWSAGPVLYRFGYRQGCKKNITDCYFTSAPVIDQCEASVYISNTEGELYSLSTQSPHFKWIHDFSEFDKLLTITPGNNGRVYVTIPVKALVLALDVSTGNVLWKKSIGPLSTAECSPVVDGNGWISIGSLDGFLYSFSPTGALKKFPRATVLDSVVQASPLLDCSGYAVYFSQTRMEGKISRTIGEYTYVSAMKPINIAFTMLVPATGAIYWTGNYPGQFSSLLSESDLHQFALDERHLLAFITAANMDNPLPCRTTHQKLASSCSQAGPKHHSIYTGNERAILLFLLFQTAFLMILAGFVRFCCIFWRKKKLRGQDLGKFLEKRHSLRVRKKAFDRTITEIEKKAAEDAVANEVLEQLGDLVREREGIERKLSTTYSLGRDGAGVQPKPLLPLYEGKTKSYSFQGSKKESVTTIFHTLSDTSSSQRSSNSSSSSNESGGRKVNWFYDEDKESAAKAKAPSEIGPSSNIGVFEVKHWESSPGQASGSQGFTNPLFVDHDLSTLKEVDMHDEAKSMEPIQQGSSRSVWLKKRRTLSSTN